MNSPLSKVRNNRNIDYLLLITVLLLIGLGLISIYSSLSLVTTPDNFILKQLIWLVVSFIAVAIILFVGNETIFELSYILYWILFSMLAILTLIHLGSSFSSFFLTNGFLRTYIPNINGAHSWFILGPLGSFQPSEFMKIILLLITADVIHKHNREKTEDSFSSDFQLLIKILKWVVPPAILTYLQPDTGMFLLYAISIFIMFCCSGIRREWLIFFFVVFVLAVVAFLFYYVNFMRNNPNGSYKMDRIEAWLFPGSNLSAGAYQSFQAQIALGSSGLNGVGLQEFLLPIPEAQTDMIFAVLGQSLGFIGGSLSLLLYAILDLRCAYIAYATTNIREKNFITGVLGLLIFQQVWNIGMVLGLLPITGITLPLLSYGGSSLLSYLIIFAIIFNSSLSKKSQYYNH